MSTTTDTTDINYVIVFDRSSETNVWEIWIILDNVNDWD